jgi:hypothetical protein
LAFAAAPGSAPFVMPRKRANSAGSSDPGVLVHASAAAVKGALVVG